MLDRDFRSVNGSIPASLMITGHQRNLEMLRTRGPTPGGWTPPPPPPTPPPTPLPAPYVPNQYCPPEDAAAADALAEDTEAERSETGGMLTLPQSVLHNVRWVGGWLSWW